GAGRACGRGHTPRPARLIGDSGAAGPALSQGGCPPPVACGDSPRGYLGPPESLAASRAIPDVPGVRAPGNHRLPVAGGWPRPGRRGRRKSARGGVVPRPDLKPALAFASESFILSSA